MRVRALTTNGDMTFGASANNYLVNSPEAVAQVVQTRLGLWVGEWFLNIIDGTPYATEILGSNKSALYDAAIQSRILSSPGVKAIVKYASAVVGRDLTVTASITTIYDTPNSQPQQVSI